MSAGQLTQAQLIQRRAEVSFDNLATATDAASIYYDSAADRALVQAVAGSVLILLLGAVVVALTNRKSRRARDRASARFEHQASHDALTGLPNRGLLTDRLQQLLLMKARTGAETALLLMDLDRFKDVNETLGHDCGDELLIKVGDRLRGAIREVDTVARLGGDEFAIVLPGVAGIDAALAVADRVQAALNESFEIEGLDLDIEAGMGVVVSGRDGEDVLTLFRHADVAMHSAKKREQGCDLRAGGRREQPGSLDTAAGVAPGDRLRRSRAPLPAEGEYRDGRSRRCRSLGQVEPP